MAKKKYRTTREYLDIAAKIVTGQRQYDYGDKYQNHKNISELWSSYLGKKVSAHDVAICMLLVKVARIQTQKDRRLLYRYGWVRRHSWRNTRARR